MEVVTPFRGDDVINSKGYSLSSEAKTKQSEDD